MNLDAVMIGSSQPRELAEFYKKTLGSDPVWEDGDWSAFKIGSGAIAIGPHSDVNGSNSEPARMIINISSEDPQKEFNRIKQTGAKVIAEPYKTGEEKNSMTLCTFADPDGNYFQICSQWEDQ